MISSWERRVNRYLIDNHGITNLGIRTGADAWEVAHRAEIAKEAYQDRTVVDAHIVSALKIIFPNADFKDKYRY